MATEDRGWKSALTSGVIAEICLAGVLLTWAGSETPLGRGAFGAGVSMAVVVGAMVVFACGMLVMFLRPGRAVLLVTALVIAVAIGGLGVLAFASMAEPSFLLLALAGVMAVNILISVNRAGSRTRTP